MMGEPPVSIDDYLQTAVAPYLSKHLIGDESWLRIRNLASLLPGSITDFFGFEIRLGTPEALADFLVCSERDSVAKRALVREGEVTSRFWRYLNTFLSRWVDPASKLYKNVHNFWLEFDTSVSEEIELPSVFFGPNDLAANTAGQSSWLTEEAIPLLAGNGLHEKERECIERCLSALPEGAFLFQIGRMLSRPVDATRLCARGMSAENIPAYLESIRWPGSTSRLRELLDWLSAASVRIDVGVDAAAEVMPRIGLECYFGSGAQLIEFARALQDRGLAAAAKTSAALSWGGVVHEQVNRDRWPRDLRAISALLEGRASSVFLRWLHHIKIILSSGGNLEAKAYLAVSHHWLQPDGVRALIAGSISAAHATQERIKPL